MSQVCEGDKKKTSAKQWKKHVLSETTCGLCGSEFCRMCLTKYRFPGEKNPPKVCTSCFPEYLHQILFPNCSYSERREFVLSYLNKLIKNTNHEQQIQNGTKKQDSEEGNSSNNDIESQKMEDNDENDQEAIFTKVDNDEHQIQQESKEESEEQKEDKENKIIDGYFVTHKIKPKIPVSAKVLDKVAAGLLRMSGMYEGGQLNRSYVNRASRRKIKHIEPVSKIEKRYIKVPYRYPTNDYNFEKYNLDPKIILEPATNDEPDTFDLCVKIYYYKSPPSDDDDHTDNDDNTDELLPVLVWLHGGGFVMGDVDDSVLNRSMSRFANMIRGIVVSVNYRLAPEFKWPTQPEDCYSAVKWVYENGKELLHADVNLITVAGDSAGGNLAAVVALMSKDRNGPPIIHQLSIYPGMDGESTESNSYEKYGNGPFLRINLLRWFKKQYLYAPDANCGVHPYLSPLMYPDLVGLPPLTMMTAGYCPLTDHAKMYADRYVDENIPVTYTEYSVSFHGFFHSFSEESVQAITQTGIIVKYHIDIAKDILYGPVCSLSKDKNIRHSHDENDLFGDDEGITTDVNCL